MFRTYKNRDHKCSFRSASLPERWDFRYYPSSDSKKVATGDGVSVLSSDSWLDSGGSSSLYSEKDVTTSDYDSVLSQASRISQGSPASSGSSFVSNQSKRSKDHDINFKKKRWDFRYYPSSDSKKVATADGDSVLSSDSWLDSGGSSSLYSEKDVTTSDYDSVLSQASRISQGSPASSGSSFVSNQSKRSKDHDINFKKKRWDFRYYPSSDSKKVATADGDSVLSSDSWLDSGGYSSLYSEKDVTTSDYDSVLSQASRISQGSPASSGSSFVSNQSKRSKDHDINFKKKRWDFRYYPSSDSKKVAAADRYSVLSSYSGLDSLESLSSYLKKDSFQSSDRRISLERKVSSKYRHVSSRRMKTYNHTDFKKKLQAGESSSSDLKKDSGSRKKEKMSPPTTQELVVGSSTGMETKSTHPPVAVQTSPPTTIQPSYTSAPPLPATEDEATRKERSETFRRALDKFRTYENPDHKCAFKTASAPHWLDFSESLFSHPLKDVAAADLDSVLSSDSGLDSLESLPSYLKKDSFRSSDSRCVSLKEMQRSYHRNIDFKKNIYQQTIRKHLVNLSTSLKSFSGHRIKNKSKSVLKFDKYGSRPYGDINLCIIITITEVYIELDSDGFLCSDIKKDVATSDHDSVLSPASRISQGSPTSSVSSCVSNQSKRSNDRDIDFKMNKPVMRTEVPFRPAASLPRWLDFSKSLFSHPLKDVAAADLDSVLSSDSGLDSLESLPSYLKKDSFRSSDSRCVSLKEMQRSYHRNIDFKKKLDSDGFLCSDIKKDVATSDHDSVLSPASRISQGSPTSSVSSCVSNQSKRSNDRDIDFKMNLLNFGKSPFSNPVKDVATADRDSVLSSHSWLGSLESLSSDLKKDSFRSSDSRCVSSRERTRSYHRNIDFKKNVPSTTSMFYTNTARWRLDFRDSSSSDSKKVATADRYSVLSSDSWKKEKTAPPTTQELVVGSSSEIETKSTHLPEAV